MATLLDTSADGRLQARYLNDRRGVLMRAKFPPEALLYQWDFEPFASSNFGGAATLTPQVRAAATVATGSSSTTSTVVPLPSGWQVGDLCYIGWTVMASTPSLTVPSGWTAVVSSFVSSQNQNLIHGVLKRVLQAGDGSVTITHASGRTSFISVAIYDFDPASPEDVTPATDTNSGVTGTSVRAPSITPIRENALLLTFHGVRNGISAVTNMSFTPPPGMTEVADVASTHGSTNTAIECARLTLTAAAATGTKTATVAGSNVTDIQRIGSAIVVKPKSGGGLPMAGAFAWKHVETKGDHKINYDVPGSAAAPIQWCGLIMKSSDTPVTVDAAVAQVTSSSGAGTTAAFNVAANSMIVAMVGYNAEAGDAAGDKITISNNKSLTVTKAVERGHLEAGANGGAVIAYMPSVAAQTGMTVTATISGVAATRDDLALKVLVLGNIDFANPIPDGVVEGTPTADIHELILNASVIEQGIALWAVTDTETAGVPVVSEKTWTAISPSTVSKSAVTPIRGQQSLLNSWTSGQQGIQYQFDPAYMINGPKGIRLSFMVLGTEGLSATWPLGQQARMEIKIISNLNKTIATNTLGFPGSTLRSWYTDFYLPTNTTLSRIEVKTYGWDSNAAARFDEIKIIEIQPLAARFVRKTDGGYVRGGDPSYCVQGTAYAYDDELTPGQLTEWLAEPIYSGGVFGEPTGTVEFTIEDRAVTLPSTMLKSVETPGLIIFVPTDQRDFTRSRSTTFVNKQTSGKPAGGVNSAFSASGDYMLITKTIDEMNDLITILDEAVLYISPTGRYNRKPFYATVSEYTILDFARMDGQEKVFNVQFQEVERPDTMYQPNYLPLRDYAWLATQYDTYSDPDLTSMTYDDLAFSAVP